MTIEEIRALDKRDDILDHIEVISGSREVPFAGRPKNPKVDEAKAYLMSLISTPISSSKQTKAIDKKAEKKRHSDHKMKNLVRVIVTDKNPVSSLADTNGQVLMEYKQYGNTVSGLRTAKVAFGVEWVIPEMLVDQMESVTYTPYVQKGKHVVPGSPIKKYSIQRLPQYTIDEINKMKLDAKMAQAMDKKV